MLLAVQNLFFLDKKVFFIDYLLSLHRLTTMDMRKKCIIVMMTMCMPFFCGHASAQVLRDSTDQVAAKIEVDGTLRNNQRMMIGKVDEAGLVRNYSFMLVGRFKEGGILVDVDGRKIGQVSADGTVRDANSVLLGSIGSNGDVRDSGNRLMGRASNVPLYQAAVFYFFDLFKVRF